MKNIFVWCVVIFTVIATQVSAQIDLPEYSPETTLQTRIGYTNLTLRYGQPSARGRKVMDGLVPYNRLWRTGAGPATQLKFSTPVKIKDKTIPAGNYALVTIPTAKQWTVMLSTDTTKVYGVPEEYDSKTEVARFTVIPEKAPRYYETLTMTLAPVNYDAVVTLLWENTQISFTLATGAADEALRRMTQALNEKPNDADVYSQVAENYLMENKNLQEALRLSDKALQLQENNWHYRLKIDILKRLKDNKAIKETADKAITFLNTNKPERWEMWVTRYTNDSNAASK